MLQQRARQRHGFAQVRCSEVDDRPLGLGARHAGPAHDRRMGFAGRRARRAIGASAVEVPVRDARQPFVGVRQAGEPVGQRRCNPQAALGTSAAFARARMPLQQAECEQPAGRAGGLAPCRAGAAGRAEQPLRQLGRRPAPRRVVVEIGQQRAVARVQFGRQRQQQHVGFGALELEAAGQRAPGRAVAEGRGRIERLRRRVAPGLRPMAVRRQQRVDLRVADVQAAKLVERQLVARAQAPHRRVRSGRRAGPARPPAGLRRAVADRALPGPPARR